MGMWFISPHDTGNLLYEYIGILYIVYYEKCCLSPIYIYISTKTLYLFNLIYKYRLKIIVDIYI